MYHILLVEDEKLVRDFITEYFNKREIKVIEATNGYEAISLINEKIDLILLDIMMPGIDGYEVCKQIRSSSNIPIIFISALSLDDNQLLAYQLGADDYITKPFKLSILYAKCLAMIKRNYHDDLNDIIKYGLIKLDNNFHQVIVDGKEKKFTPKEYAMLTYFIKNHDRLLSREQLLNDLWGYDYYGDGRAVDTYIKKIRKLIAPLDYIKTIRKSGYIFSKGEH